MNRIRYIACSVRHAAGDAPPPPDEADPLGRSTGSRTVGALATSSICRAPRSKVRVRDEPHPSPPDEGGTAGHPAQGNRTPVLGRVRAHVRGRGLRVPSVRRSALSIGRQIRCPLRVAGVRPGDSGGRPSPAGFRRRAGRDPVRTVRWAPRPRVRGREVHAPRHAALRELDFASISAEVNLLLGRDPRVAFESREPGPLVGSGDVAAPVPHTGARRRSPVGIGPAASPTTDRFEHVSSRGHRLPAGIGGLRRFFPSSRTGRKLSLTTPLWHNPFLRSRCFRTRTARSPSSRAR